ncbi:MAG: CaiB/BaiF CoA transferase family protein [Burkholderiaceae bacterium]
MEGIKVVELGQWIAAPLCAAILGDLGADVIKVERPGGDNQRFTPPFSGGEGHVFMAVNRSKRGVIFDLSDESDRALCRELLLSADVVIENFRPGMMARYGLEHASLAERNPRLIYCSISGFGQDGPMRDAGGFDIVAQAMSGLMSLCGPADGPPHRLPVPIADIGAGLHAAIGILAALQARQSTGRGQFVEITLLESALSFALLEVAGYLGAGIDPPRLGQGARNASPYQVFETGDRAIVIAAAGQGLWERLCRVLDCVDLIDDSRFATNEARLSNNAELVEVLQARLKERPAAVWLPALSAAGIPAAPVSTVPEALKLDPFTARNGLTTIRHTAAGEQQLLSAPLHLSATPATVRLPAPVLGEHEAAVKSAIRAGHWPTV